MNRNDIADTIYASLRAKQVTRKEATEAADTLISAFRQSLEDGVAISIRGLFTIFVDDSKRQFKVSLPTTLTPSGAPRVVTARARLRIKTSDAFRTDLTKD